MFKKDHVQQTFESFQNLLRQHVLSYTKYVLVSLL